MNIKRILSFILAAAMVLSLAACAGSKTASVPSYVDEDGKFVYKVVRSGEQKIPVIEDSSKTVRNTIKDNLGVNVTMIKDTAYEDYDNNYEILVGDTNREESAIAKQRIIDNRTNNASDFIVAVINDKICINATEDDAIKLAADWFIKTFCQSLETWALLRNDYQFIYAPETMTTSSNLDGVDLGTFSVVLPLKTSLMIGMGADDIISYYSEFNYTMQKLDDVEEEQKYEILIGDCDRQASKSVTVEADNFIIKVIGTKIVIKGGSVLATWRGTQAFISLLKEAEQKESRLTLTDGYTVNGKYDKNEEGTYTLNWYDEFDGNKLNHDMWSPYSTHELNDEPEKNSLGGLSYSYSTYGYSNYSGSGLKNLVYQSDGKLNLGIQCIGNDVIYSRATTFYTMVWRYGVLDIYAKFAQYPVACCFWPNASGNDNIGSAFGNRFGNQKRTLDVEIDISETFGSSDTFSSNIHLWWSKHDADGRKTSGISGHSSMDGDSRYTGNSTNNKKFIYNAAKYGDKGFSDDYHMYSLYWDDECIKFAFDGKVYCDYQFDENMSPGGITSMLYLIIGNGLAQPGYGDSDKYDPELHGRYFEQQLDYVHIYQTGAKTSQLIKGWAMYDGEYSEGKEIDNTGTSVIMYPNNPIGAEY
ncbi:MAG: hypothetical protein U0M42_09060 [Acutalibacteraceae bacterium]|nr:hypothetical protein [Acutalibacteraceae bacterium]